MPVIDKLNLVIPKGQRVGLVGATGVGKSTLLDILMGLLAPTCGQLLIDGKPLGISGVDTVLPEVWRRQIAHVPQHIFLADTSIASNIAFGLPLDELNHARLEQVVEQAQLAEFIKTLPDGLNTVVGERGVRLSGGQRQRVGVARALAADPAILLLDEPFGALDPITRSEMQKEFRILQKRVGKTMVFVTHDMRAAGRAKRVVRLADGAITN